MYVLKSLQDNDLIRLLQHTLQKDELLHDLSVDIKETTALINISGGDARKLLNLFELVISTEASRVPQKKS